jgi:hypothetical protein
MGASTNILRYPEGMAQDPGHDDDTINPGELDPSADLDMVTLYEAQVVDAEIEADMIRGVLESNGIPALVMSNFGYPNLGFEVKVPRAMLEDARRLVEEAKAAGPEAAAEAERDSEQAP